MTPFGATCVVDFCTNATKNLVMICEIQGQLADWARDPAQLAEDDLTAPNAATIARASLVASTLHENGAQSPNRVVPTGDGGIAFQFERGHEFISIEVEPEGVIELLAFDDGRLRHRSTL
jgi:hypothetical protein